MDSIELRVVGEPPRKGEARSMLSEGHGHSPRVRALLAAALEARQATGFGGFGRRRIGIDVTLRPVRPAVPAAGDATNTLGGIGDALQSNRVNVDLSYLGDLANAFLYDDDPQIREVRYREGPGAIGYTVRLWALPQP
jgi:hypothetical protein